MHKIRLKSIAVLTSKKSWFVPYAREFAKNLEEEGYQGQLFHRYEDIAENYQIVFILSYFKLIKGDLLKEHRHNLVVHESDLPLGRGWAPLFWQVLEGKRRIPVVLFEVVPEVDAGEIYIKDYIHLKGHEVHDEIRKLQAEKTTELCFRFLEDYDSLHPFKQTGEPSYYGRRIPEDSELDINKSLKEQFNLLRIVNNDEFPAFFRYKDYKYVLKIFREECGDTSSDKDR